MKFDVKSSVSQESEREKLQVLVLIHESSASELLCSRSVLLFKHPTKVKQSRRIGLNAFRVRFLRLREIKDVSAV